MIQWLMEVEGLYLYFSLCSCSDEVHVTEMAATSEMIVRRVQLKSPVSES